MTRKARFKIEWTMKAEAGYMARVSLESSGRTVFGYGNGRSRREAVRAALERANGRDTKRDAKIRK